MTNVDWKLALLIALLVILWALAAYTGMSHV